MSLDEFDELRHRSADIRIGGGATLIDIARAQDELGVEFPDDYLRFLTAYGWVQVGCDYIYGLGSEVPDFANVIFNTIDERESFEPFLPRHLIPIMNDGSGNHCCLDSSRGRAGGSPVVFWDHESEDGPSQIPIVISPSFATWLLGKVQASGGQRAK